MLIPSRDFRLETALPPEAVGARLAAAVEPVRWFRGFWEPHLAFQGEVSADGFRMTRVIGYRNSFLPIVRGRVVATANGSRVEGTMELHPTVGAFMALWLSGVLLGCLITGLVAGHEILSGRNPNPALLAPFGMIVFGWAITAGGFAFEARRALRLLQQIVGASVPVPPGEVVR